MNDDNEDMSEDISDKDYTNLFSDNRTSERRMQFDKRELIDQYLRNGWEIVSRSPVTLQRGRLKKYFRNGVLMDKG